MSEPYTVHDEHDSHFIVSKMGGKKFRVAKAGLSPELVKRIQVIHASQGFGMPDPDEEASQYVTSPPPTDETVDSPTPVSYQDPGTAPQAGYLGNPADTPASVTNTTPPAAPPPAPQEQPAAAQPSPKPSDDAEPPPKPTPAPLAGMEGEEVKAGRENAEAIQAKAKIEADKAMEVHGLAQSNVKALQDRASKIDQDFADNQKYVDKAMTDVANGKIDPNHFWASRTTGQKIAGIIGLILGGIGGGIAGTGNKVAEMMDEAHKQDIETQKANLENKRSTVRMYMERGHNIEDAGKLAFALHQDIGNAQMVAMAAKYAGPEAAAAAQQQLAVNHQNTNALRMQVREKNQQLVGQQLDNAIKQQEFAMQRAVLPIRRAAETGAVLPGDYGALLDPERRVAVPGVNGQQSWTLANTKGDRDKLTDLRQNYGAGMAAIKRIEDLSNTMGMGGTDTQRGMAALKDLQSSLHEIMGSSDAKRGPEEDELTDAFSNPTKWFKSVESIKAQMKVARDIMTKHMLAANAARLVGGQRAAAGMLGAQ